MAIKKIDLEYNNQEAEILRKRLEEINSQLTGESIYVPELEFGIYILVKEAQKELLEKIKKDFKSCWEYGNNDFESEFDHILFEKKILNLEKSLK